MEKHAEYKVYPQKQPFHYDEVESFDRLPEALEAAWERARAGEDVQVTVSEDRFVSFKTIARINAVPTEDLL